MQQQRFFFLLNNMNCNTKCAFFICDFFILEKCSGGDKDRLRNCLHLAEPVIGPCQDVRMNYTSRLETGFTIIKFSGFWIRRPAKPKRQKHVNAADVRSVGKPGVAPHLSGLLSVWVRDNLEFNVFNDSKNTAMTVIVDSMSFIIANKNA